MATWTDISRDTYRRVFDCPDNIEAKNNVEMNLQYDADSITPVSVTLRYKLVSKTGKNYWDKFYIVTMKSNADGTLTANTLYKVKDTYTDGGGSWPYYSSAFKVSKAYDASKFSLPALYLIDNGNNAVKISSASGAYTAATGSRKSWTVFRAAANIEILKSETVADAVDAGTVSITSNSNNTFKLVGYKNTSTFTNNSISKSILQWTVKTPKGVWWEDDNENFKTAEFTGNSLTKDNLSLKDYGGLSTANTRKVAARVISVGAYNTKYPSYTEVDIPQYTSPNDPSGLEIVYNKTKFTLRENWTLEWENKGMQGNNTNSSVCGYRLRLELKKKGTSDFVRVPIKNASNKVISTIRATDTTNTDWMYDTGSTATSFTIYPEKQNLNPTDNKFKFEVGDTVRFSLFAYAKDPENNVYWSGGGKNAVYSPEYTIENAGIMRVKVDGAWKEGQVWVKVGNEWKEATAVHVKVGNSWKESI